MTLAAPLDAPIAPTDDQRRITENDPRVVALRAVWRSRIARSIGQLTRELRALPPHTSADATLSVFIHRHVGLLRAAYQDGHELGARDYYAGVSRRPQQWARTVETDERTERRRLAFYAPSVAKMAHEALLAWQQDQAARVHASEAIITFSGEGYNPYRDAHGRFAPGPHAPREGEGEGGAGHGGSLKPEGERGTGSYLARFTPRPHEDLARGWTGGMMKAQPTPEDADIAWIHDRYGSGEVGLLEEKWKEETDNVEAEAQYYGHPFTRPARMEDDEKFMLRVERDYRLDPREAAPGKWVIYDHPGLAGHKVRVENHTREPDTDQSAAEAAHKQRDMYRFNYHAGEDGDATVGEVRYVRDLGGGLHLFWAQNVVPEHETRQQYREQSGNLSVRMFADDSLDQWQGSLGARLTLQADVSWSGLQDGYVDAGAGDSIGLYSLLYWLLEPLAAHCDGCLEYAANSPYNAPGLGGNTLDTAPGAGMTECGAACKCSLSYAAPGEIEQPFWNTMFAAKQQEWIASGQQNSPLPNVAGPARTDTAVVTQPLPRRAPPTIPLEPLEPLTLPMEGAPLTDEQKSALDLYRATALAWEEWRGGLPPLPKMFADLADAVTGTDPQVNAWLDNMPSWTQLSPKQQQLLGQVYEALADWALATSEAAHDAQTLPPPDVTGGGTLFAEWMAGRRLLHGYNPYRDPHGRFAPGPHAPREGEGEGGGGGGGGSTTHAGHPVHQMTPAEREAKAQGELDAAHARYQHALDSHGVANQELRQARIHESTAAAAYADAHKNAEGELRHQAMQDAKVREPARYAQYERLARAAQEHVDRFNDLSRQEPHALDHVATVRRALFARGLSAREVDAHPDYVQASRDFHAIANERKLQGHLYTQSTRAANRAADRLVGDRVSEDAIHAHPLVAPAHAALTAASAHANALEANRQHWEHEAVSAQAAVQRAEGMLDVARGGSGVAVKYWPSRAGQSAQDAIHQTFGRDLSEHELAKLSGASVGDKMDVQPAVGTQGGISVSLRGPGIERRFSVVRDAQNGDIILHDEYTANKGERTAGSGRDLIRGMDNMRAVGVTRLYATAARGPALNGYHTWARMGFVGDVPHGLKLAVKSHFGPTVTRVEQVMERPGGAAWWKQFGSTWDAEFDFHPGSYSMRRLDRLRAMIDRHGEG